MEASLCVERLSAQYHVRRLRETDLEEIFALCNTNPQYYEACGVPATREGILRDLALCPPGKELCDKYFLGFYEPSGAKRLTAALDLIAGYPDAGTAYFGLFMVDGTRAGQGLGTALLKELAASLKAAGFGAIQLGYEKSNPQASGFWQKNGFQALRECRHEYGLMVAARREL